MKTYELKVRQVCLLFIAFLPLTKFFMMPSVLSQTANEDMWISALISVLLDFAVVAVITFFCKEDGRTAFEILEDSIGKTPSKILLFLYFLFFLFKGILPVCEQKDYVENTLYVTMPNVIYFIPFFVCAFYISIKRVRVLGRTADVFWLITAVGFILLVALSLPNTDFKAILPVGARGAKNIFNGTYKSFVWFGDGAYFAFLTGQFKREKKDGLKILLSFAVSAVMIVFFLIVFNGIFTSIGFRQKFALTETAKYTTVINSTGRFDYIGIACILFSNFISLSLPVFFASKILDNVFEIKKCWISPLIVCTVYLAVVTLLEEYFFSVENLAINLMSGAFFVFGDILPLLLPVLIRRRKIEKVKA